MTANADPVNNIDPTGNFSMAQSLTATAILGALTINTINMPNLFSLDKNDTSMSDKDFTDVQVGVMMLLAYGNSSPAFLRMALQDQEEVIEYQRVEEQLQNIVDELREKDPAESISVPGPPRKKGWYTCIARAQDLARTFGNLTFGWGWGMSKEFHIAKNAAVQMANSSIGAVDTHHAQWRCRAPDGTILRP